jgi:proline dehydrogenase
MLRQGLLWLSQQNGIFNFIRSNPLARRFAARFVAGETIDEGVAAAVEMHKRGITSSLDLLGESVTQAAEATAAKDQYLAMLDRMAAASPIEVNVSVKLTQMGFDIDEELCRRNMVAILERARTLGGFVRLDMESSAYTQRTLDFFEHRLFPDFGPHCKGAYLEPPSVAFPDKADVDRNYVRLLETLLAHGNYPGVATHDEKIIAHARKFAQRQGIGSERFEFQMLYGVRRDLQEELRRTGHRMRVYIPFGTQWYPYLMRRLAERPANIAFMMGSIARETVGGR